MRDLISRLDFKRAFSPAAATTDNTALVSSILDRRGAESVALVLNLGSLADADATFAVTLDHGDAANLSDAVAVPSDMMNGTLTLASFDFSADNALRKLGYVGGKRYVRATITPTNNSGNAFISGVWVLGRNNLAPTANPPV